MTNKAAHNAYQREYYENRQKPNMQPAETPYVLQHVNNMIRFADLEPGHSILEIGAGLGRCSLPLLARGYRLMCTDISPQMLNHISARAGGLALRTMVVDIAAAGSQTEEKFDRAIGFFTLHHMHDIEACLRGAAQVLKPGGMVAFCEPVAFNPLYYIQILCTRDMLWKAEKGILNMRRSLVFQAMRCAGFEELRHMAYGFFPPFITNTAWGRNAELTLEKSGIFGWCHAFQIFSGRKCT